MIFSTGLPALKTVQENEKLLVKLSEVLNAPREKLVEVAARFVKEWKEVRREKRRLMKEVVAKDVAKVQNANGAMTFQPINGVRFATQRFVDVDVERMIKTASRLVQEDPTVVAFFYGISERTARVVVMAGREALGLGVDSSEIAGAAAAVLGGGGSGRSDFAQGGGPSVEKVPTALATAEEVIQKQILDASKG
jgi:alanyl-tRNA synthetase